MRKSWVALALILTSACTQVDTTEHCILTRYGKVVTKKMDVGLNFTPFTHATCFKVTDTNFPVGSDTSHHEIITAQTRDPITILGDVALVYRFDDSTVYDLFLEKRSEQAAEVEILNAIREGYRNAIAGWTIQQIFEHRATLSDSVKAHIQRKIGKKASIVSVFVRDIKVPQQIEEARIASQKQELVLKQALQQYTIDSVQARSNVVTAEGEAKANQLRAQSYSSNAKLLDLEIAKAFSTICANASTCIIGGSTADLIGLKK
jgi:hypothetical protein